MWAWLKANWQTLFTLAIMALGFYGWWQHNMSSQANLAQVVTQINAANQAEIDNIVRAHDLEQQQHAQELQSLQSDIARINSDYATAQQQIGQRKTQEEHQIVQRYGNDMVGLSSLLADKFNLTIVEVK